MAWFITQDSFLFTMLKVLISPTYLCKYAEFQRAHGVK